MYGMGAFRLAPQRSEPAEAEAFWRPISRLPGVRRYLDETIETARGRAMSRRCWDAGATSRF